MSLHFPGGITGILFEHFFAGLKTWSLFQIPKVFFNGSPLKSIFQTKWSLKSLFYSFPLQWFFVHHSKLSRENFSNSCAITLQIFFFRILEKKLQEIRDLFYFGILPRAPAGILQKVPCRFPTNSSRNSFIKSHRFF